MDVSQYFQEDEKDKCVRFIGDKLLCYIPQRYENLGYLDITDKVTTIGVFPMLINDKFHCGLQLPGIIQIEQSELTQETKDGVEYYVLELHRGDKILRTTDLLENDKVGYIMWLLYVSNGVPLTFADYEMMAGLFDDIKEFTGKDIGANHAIYEMIIAHLSRDPKDLTKLWRHTSMTPGTKPKQLPLRAIGEITTSTHAKLTGSYFAEALNSAAITQDTDTNPDSLENLFRT